MVYRTFNVPQVFGSVLGVLIMRALPYGRCQPLSSGLQSRDLACGSAFAARALGSATRLQVGDIGAEQVWDGVAGSCTPSQLMDSASSKSLSSPACWAHGRQMTTIPSPKYVGSSASGTSVLWAEARQTTQVHLHVRRAFMIAGCTEFGGGRAEGRTALFVSCCRLAIHISTARSYAARRNVDGLRLRDVAGALVHQDMSRGPLVWALSFFKRL